MRLYAIQRLESVYITGVVCPKKNTKYSQGLPRTAAREVYTKYGNVAEKPECPVNSCISLREMQMADSRWTQESRFVLILYRFVSSFSFELCYDYL